MGTIQVEHRLKYFISLPNQNQHFTFLVPRIRCQSPWKREVQQIMTSVPLWTVLASCYFPSMSFCFSQCCENGFHICKWVMVSWQGHDLQKSGRQRGHWLGSCCAAIHTQVNFTPWKRLSSTLAAAVKLGAAPWLLLVTARHGHTSQPVRHSGYQGTGAKHTCTIWLWFHG